MPKKQNKKIIVGIDEVGRGPLAGPVIAVAITGQQFSIFPPARAGNSSGFARSRIARQFSNIKDSKKTNPKQREKIYKFLKTCPEVKWGTGMVSEKVIDKINIFEATKLAMVKAVKDLEKQLGKKANILLIDGNFGINLKTPQKSIIKGDEKIFEIKLASIIAKVERDRIMVKYHKKYPQYGFDKHKGYGTKLHFKMIKKYGPCAIHRKSFEPIKSYCKK